MGATWSEHRGRLGPGRDGEPASSRLGRASETARPARFERSGRACKLHMVHSVGMPVHERSAAWIPHHSAIRHGAAPTHRAPIGIVMAHRHVIAPRSIVVHPVMHPSILVHHRSIAIRWRICRRSRLGDCGGCDHPDRNRQWQIGPEAHGKTPSGRVSIPEFVKRPHDRVAPDRMATEMSYAPCTTHRGAF